MVRVVGKRRSDNLSNALSRWPAFLAVFAVTAILVLPVRAGELSEPADVRIGVLAHKGVDSCRAMWQPTIDFLAERMPYLRFQLVPLGFNEIETAAAQKQIDFFISNPAIYVDLEMKHGAVRLLTLRNRVGSTFVTQFGGVIFRRADRTDLPTVHSLRGRRFSAVRPNSFGGFIMALRELKAMGIDPDRDFASLDFAGSHPDVVRTVLEGRADAGTVRTDTLERMAAQGIIRLEDFTVFPAEAEHRNTSFPFAYSTRLYSEWPFAKLGDTSEELAKHLVIALLRMEPDSPAALAAESGGWVTCLSYQTVHEGLRELRISPYRSYGKVTAKMALKRFWVQIALAGAMVATLGILLVRMLVLNRKLGHSRAAVRRELDQRMQTEEALRQSEEEFRTLVQNIPGAVYRCELHAPWRVIHISEGVLPLTGRSALDFMEARVRWADIVEPEDLPDLRKTVDDGIAQDRPYEAEYRIRYADGGLRWVYEKGVCKRGKEGEPLFLDGVIIDATERKRTLAVMEARLRLSDFASLHSLDELLQKTLDEAEELTGSHIGFFHFVDEDQRTLSLQAWSSSTLNGICTTKGQERHYDLEKAGVWADCLRIGRPVVHNDYARLSHKKGLPPGHARVIRELVVPVFRGNRVMAIIGVGNKAQDYDAGDQDVLARLANLAWDIVLRKRAEEERLEFEKRLLHAQKLESLGVMAGGIAHDFNNLLMGVLGHLELALDDISSVSSARSNIEYAIQAAKRAAHLTHQMLAYSGMGHFVVQEVSLNDLVEENVSILKTAISKKVTFALHLDRSLPCILADTGQLQQVIMNLITNASEAFGEETGQISLRTSVREYDEEELKESVLEEKRRAGRFVCLEVSDTGCGMGEETRGRLFDPFFTTKFAGRGLGMSAVLGIVRGHRGAILVESAVGKGTTIRILFPAMETSRAPAPPKNGERPALKKGDSQTGARTVLVVDDEKMVLDLCRSMLERMGFRVLTAEDGLEAVSLFESHGGEIDCVLLDLTMPRLDGAATLGELRRLDPNVTVVLSSGYTQKEARGRITGKSPAAFIQKPYSGKVLKETLEGVLKKAD